MNANKFSDAMSEIDTKYIDEALNYNNNAKQKATKPSWIKWGAMVACFSVIAIAAVSILLNYFNRQGTAPPDNSNIAITDNPDNTESQSPGNSSVELVVNQLDEPLSMLDVDVQITNYDNLSYDAWKLIEEDFYTFANISYDDFVALIPEELRMNMTFCSLATKGYNDSEQDDEYRLHDYVFDCESDDGAQVTIALCNFETPIRDWFILDENPELSNVNGTSVTIYGYDNMYMVNFSYKGINYDIETKDMDLNQLQELLVNIMF